MILIRHFVAPSSVEGVGLFTLEDIQKDQPVYQFDWRFVMLISSAELAEMPEAARESILKYSYRGRGAHRLSGAFYYCADDSRFFNHSDTPNCKWVEGDELYIASTFIPANTELTCDYREFVDPSDLGEYNFLQ